MSRFRWSLVATTAVVAAACAATGPAAQATPAAPIASARPVGPSAMQVRATLAGKQVHVTVHPGVFSEDAPGVAIRDRSGNLVGRIPAAFQSAGRLYPVAHHLAPRHVVVLSSGSAARPAAALPVATPYENQLAANDGVSMVELAVALGPLAGAVGGALVGLAAAAASCVVLNVACIVTALPIIGVFAGAGGVAGTALLGGGALGLGAMNYFTTVQAPPGHSHYAGQGGLDPKTGVPNPALRDDPVLPTGSSAG